MMNQNSLIRSPLSPQHGLTLQARFLGSLRKPFSHQKCIELSQLIQEALATKSKELHACYVPLLDNIFGFARTAYDTCGDWGLKSTYRDINPHEFELLEAFLRPEGALFQLIRYLHSDPTFVCEFPISCLPVPTRILMEDGLTPQFYLNKAVPSISPVNVCLNPLEYYWFIFCYSLQTQSKLTQRILNDANGNPSNLASVFLFESYLKYFVPLSDVPAENNRNASSSPHSIWESLSSTTSNLLTGNLPFQPGSSSTPAVQKPTLLNTKFLNNIGTSPSNNIQNQQTLDMFGTQASKSETFIMIFSEMLLNVSLPTQTQRKRQSPSHVDGHFLPSADHVRAVRIFVKHLHFFANSAPNRDQRTNPQFNLSTSPLDDLKRNVWTGGFLVQSRLYGFLRLCFESWPSDASFRLPLETWLSYIQPWRYCNWRDSAASGGDNEDHGSSSEIDESWKPFIASNLLFYSVIFRQVLSRFQALDMFTSKNAMMFSRVVKVFSQTNLVSHIMESEIVYEDPMQSWAGAHSRGSLLSPSARMSGANSHSSALGFRQKMLDYEDNSFVYTSLFSDETKDQVRSLVRSLKLTKEELSELIRVASTPIISNEPPASLFTSIKGMFSPEKVEDVEENKNLSEHKKAETYLNNGIPRLQQLFSLEDEQIEDIRSDVPDSLRLRGSHMSSPVTKFATPDMGRDASGAAKLTQRGRYQVINRLCQPNIEYEGNPDTQPTRSYEIGRLVFLLAYLSNWINFKYGHVINDFYKEKTFIGGFVRGFLAPPTTYVRVSKSINALPHAERITESLPPRVHFRALANYYILVVIALLISFFYLRGYSQITLALLAFLGSVSYGVIYAIAEKVKQSTRG